jgi:O-acetylhomoserine/O-acetylserine sulfhydrylase-like pyridoxal-dependent enzyme
MNKTLMQMGDKIVAVRRTFKGDTEWLNLTIRQYGGEAVAAALGGEKLIKNNTNNMYYLIDEVTDIEWESK